MTAYVFYFLLVQEKFPPWVEVVAVTENQFSGQLFMHLVSLHGPETRDLMWPPSAALQPETISYP